MTEHLSPDPLVTINELIAGYFKTQLVYIAAKLRLADLLAERPRRLDELEGLVAADPSALRRIVRALVVYGVLREDAEGRLQPTSAGAYLASDHPHSVREYALFVGELHYPAWGEIAHSVRTGATGFEAAFGRPFFAYLAQHPEAGARFQALMSGGTRREAEALAATYDFSRSRVVVDVGGGHGTLLDVLLQTHPHLRGVLLERDALASAARAALARAGVGDRCMVMAGDFFAAVPAGGDTYVLSWVLHDWDDEEAVRILRRCRDAMPAEGWLLISELIAPERVEVDAPPGSPSERVARLDLSMLVLMGGRERTVAEFEALLVGGGFRLEQALRTESPRSLLVAAPA
jgi:SAM-dependent methyltransferase